MGLNWDWTEVWDGTGTNSGLSIVKELAKRIFTFFGTDLYF